MNEAERKLAEVESWARRYLEPDDVQVAHYMSAWEFNDPDYDGQEAANELRRILGWPERIYQ